MMLDNGVYLSDEEKQRLIELETDFLVIGFPGFFGVVTNMIARDKMKSTFIESLEKSEQEEAVL